MPRARTKLDQSQHLTAPPAGHSLIVGGDVRAYPHGSADGAAQATLPTGGVNGNRQGPNRLGSLWGRRNKRLTMIAESERRKSVRGLTMLGLVLSPLLDALLLDLEVYRRLASTLRRNLIGGC
jgi:hypothetical protein